jgi:hypothetical protein
VVNAQIEVEESYHRYHPFACEADKLAYARALYELLNKY